MEKKAGKVLLICNYKRHGVREIADEMCSYLLSNGYEAVAMSNCQLDDFTVDTEYSLFIVLGGDGTVLSTAHKVAREDAPILAVNFGTIGFMMEVEKEDWKKALDSFIDGSYTCEKHMMLDVTVMRGDKVIDKSTVLNEGVINCPDCKLMKLSVTLGKDVLGYYMADGLIIATSTGSTAYSSSAGGPIVSPELETVILTPICPYSYIVRPVVVSPDNRITVSMESRSNSRIMLVLDGQRKILLQGDETVVFEKSSCQVKIITIPGSDELFYEKLQARMCLQGAEE